MEVFDNLEHLTELNDNKTVKVCQGKTTIFLNICTAPTMIQNIRQ